jgi:septal ring factor EnvC (AmiA/AmiB activator)
MRVSKWTVIMFGGLCAVPLLATQATPSAVSSRQADSADRLLREVKAEAQTIEMHANQLQQMANDPSTQWAQFDKQWNEIKPAQEALDMHLWRLEAMRSSLSAPQRKELDGSKQAAQQISARTRQFYKMIDQSGANLASSSFRGDAQSLAKDAQSVARSA